MKRESSGDCTQDRERTKQLGFTLLQELCKLGVTVGVGRLFQRIQGHAWFEETLGLGQALELLKRGQVGVIAFAHLAAGIHCLRGKPTRAMEVEIDVEGLPVEALDLVSLRLRDVSMAHLLADDGAILALHQGLVVGASRTGFGKLNEQLVE